MWDSTATCLLEQGAPVWPQAVVAVVGGIKFRPSSQLLAGSHVTRMPSKKYIIKKIK